MAKLIFLILLCICYPMHFAYAQGDYPTRPIEVLIGFAPGGATDTVARVINPEVQKQLGGSIIVVNKPGASGSVAAKQVSKSRPDGYTLLCVPIQHAIFPAISENPPYSIHDFEPIGRLVTSPNILLTNSNSPWKTFGEAIEYARKNPGKLKVGVAGIGSIGSMIYEIIKRKANVELTILPFNSEIDAMTSVLGGHADLCSNSLGITIAHIKANRLKALAITGQKRNPLLTEVHTLVEIGYSEASFPTFVGMLAPLKVPKDRMGKISKAYEKAITDPEVISSLNKTYYFPDYLPPQEFQKFLVSQYEQFKKIADEANIKIK